MGSADELVELKRRLLAGEINAEEYRRAKIAAYQAGAPRSHSDRLPRPGSARVPRATVPEATAAAAIEAKRRKLAASLSKRREETSPGLRLVVIVRPRGMRTTARLKAEEAERMRQEGLRLAGLAPEAPEPAEPLRPANESPEDYIERRLREARERLRGS